MSKATMNEPTSADKKRLSIHHIGGRGGGRGFPVLPSFEPDIISVLYDADPDCLAQVRTENKYFGSELYVLPYCIGESCGDVTFHLNYDPYTSSVRELNAKYGSFYLPLPDYDYLFSESIRAMEKPTVSVVSLDHLLLHSKSLAVPPPDFLSIDTQGSEYEILQGAKGCLDATLGLILEVEFHPLYQGQKLFGDLAHFLAGQGFEFVRFLHIGEAPPFRAPLGQRGQGFQVWGDALFLKNLSTIPCDDNDSLLKLAKLAFFAVVFNQFEYGLNCLKRMEQSSLWTELRQSLQQTSYIKFLAALQEAVNQMPAEFPETFADGCTFEASKNRFQDTQDSSTLRARLVRSVKRATQNIPPLFRLLKKTRNGLRKMRLGLESALRAPRRRGGLGWRYSRIERLLRAHLLDEQADVLRQQRLAQADCRARKSRP
jgi:FkbM family methyltransferase